MVLECCDVGYLLTEGCHVIDNKCHSCVDEICMISISNALLEYT